MTGHGKWSYVLPVCPFHRLEDPQRNSYVRVTPGRTTQSRPEAPKSAFSVRLFFAGNQRQALQIWAEWTG